MGICRQPILFQSFQHMNAWSFMSFQQKEKNKNLDIKQKGVKSTSSQVESAYYTVDDKTNEAIGSDNESLEPTPSEMYGEDNQLNVIKKLFEINWEKLNSEFDSEKNKGRREQH